MARLLVFSVKTDKQ